MIERPSRSKLPDINLFRDEAELMHCHFVRIATTGFTGNSATIFAMNTAFISLALLERFLPRSRSDCRMRMRLLHTWATRLETLLPFAFFNSAILSTALYFVAKLHLSEIVQVSMMSIHESVIVHGQQPQESFVTVN
jgi:hypothetical protein